MHGLKLRFFINWIISCPYHVVYYWSDGVMDYWSNGPNRLFEISKLLFQYSNTPILQYSSLKYFDHIQELES